MKQLYLAAKKAVEARGINIGYARDQFTAVLAEVTYKLLSRIYGK